MKENRINSYCLNVLMYEVSRKLCSSELYSAGLVLVQSALVKTVCPLVPV